MRSRPPRLATFLVEGLTGSPHLLGDLEEEFHDRSESGSPWRARLWYWRQALRLLPALGLPRLARGLAPSALGHDLRASLRTFRRTPGVAFAGALTLGIGIGGPAALFGITDGMFSPLPVPDADDVVRVQLVDPSSGTPLFATADAWEAWRDRTSRLTHLGAYVADRVAVASDAMVPMRVASARVTPDVLDLLAVAPIHGRLFAESDLRADAERVALIREDIWRTNFAADPGVLGQTIRVDGRPHTVVGVLPAAFGFPEQQRLWTAFAPSWDRTQPVQLVGRLARDADPAAVEEALSSTVPLLARADSVIPPGARVQAEEYVLATLGVETRRMLRFLLLVVSSLVVIAASNVAALLLARGASRRPEIAVRLAIGAGRGRVARQLMVEALALALVGMLVALLLATPAVEAFARVLANRGSLPYWADFGLTGGVVGFTSGLMLLATLAAGLVPAVRTSDVDLSAAMRSGDLRGGRRAGRVLPTLVGVEVTLACVLLVLSGLVVKGALGQVQRGAGFDTRDVMTARFVLEDFSYGSVEERARFHDAFEARLAEDESLGSFAFTTALPGDGSGAVRMQLAHRTTEAAERWPATQIRSVGPRFFDAFSMELQAGRTFSRSDRRGSAPVVVVNQAFLDQRESSTDIVGRHLRIQVGDGPPVAHEVVGVVSDPGVSVDDGRRVAAVFRPFAQEVPEAMIVAFRGQGGPETALARVREHAAALDPDLPFDAVRTLEQVIRRENDGGRVFGLLFGFFGLAALVLATVGLHGVVSFTARQRRHEIGVMRALGAPRGRLLRRTTLRGMRPVVCGLGVGLAIAWGIAPLIGDGLFGTDPHDPFILSAVPILLLVGGLVASLGPAIRVSGIDPAAAFRSE